MSKNSKLNQKPKSRSLLIKLPLHLADALDLTKVRRQQMEGRVISKKALVIEAIEHLAADAK